MKKILFVIMVFFATVGSANAGEAYLGVDLRSLDYDSNGFEADLIAVTGKVGYKFIDYLSIEGFIGLGVSDDETGSGISLTKLEVDRISGVFIKGEYPINEKFSIYGLVGKTEVKMTAENSLLPATTDTTDDTSFGAGAQFNFKDNMSLSLDYNKYIDKSFGSEDNFKKLFFNATKSVEGSGWGILAYQPDADKLVVLQAEKHHNQSQWVSMPILVCDVWEHAYYLNYQNKRGDYINGFMKVVNWDNVSALLDGYLK